METNLTLEAFKFMVLGMGVVFSFLIVMIFALKAQAYLLARFLPEKQIPVKAKSPSSESTANNTTKKVAAIAAVLQHHNNLKG